MFIVIIISSSSPSSSLYQYHHVSIIVSSSLHEHHYISIMTTALPSLFYHNVTIIWSWFVLNTMTIYRYTLCHYIIIYHNINISLLLSPYINSPWVSHSIIFSFRIPENLHLVALLMARPCGHWWASCEQNPPNEAIRWDGTAVGFFGHKCSNPVLVKWQIFKTMVENIV